MRLLLHLFQGVPCDGEAGPGAPGLPHFFHRLRLHGQPVWKGGGFSRPRPGGLRQRGDTTIAEAEPIGPKKLLDVLIIAPCTGNSLAKLSHSIADTAVTMAAKSHLRNGRPVVVAVSTNDGLAGAAENIGRLLARKHYFFVPYGQDDSQKKPTSLVAHFDLIPETMELAVQGVQLQPLLV